MNDELYSDDEQTIPTDYEVVDSTLVFNDRRYEKGNTVPVAVIPAQWLGYYLKGGHLRAK